MIPYRLIAPYGGDVALKQSPDKALLDGTIHSRLYAPHVEERMVGGWKELAKPRRVCMGV